MPSAEVAILLIDIFFARVFNAHLLFHKETFMADFVANRIPDFVALSVFACASMYACFPPSVGVHSLISEQFSAPSPGEVTM